MALPNFITALHLNTKNRPNSLSLELLYFSLSLSLYSKEYERVWDYAATIRKYNPGSTSIVKVTGIETGKPSNFGERKREGEIKEFK